MEEVLTVLNIQGKIKKINRRGKNTRGPRVIVIELNDKITRNEAINNATNIRSVTKLSSVYVNKNLTLSEIEEERAARKVRKKKNDALEFDDDGLRYGKMSGGIEYYRGMRIGRVCRIDKATKRMI